MKQCARCKAEKPESEYSKNSAKADRLDVYCKVCIKTAREAAAALLTLEERRAKWRAYEAKNQARIASERRRRYADRPEEVHVQDAERHRVLHVDKLATDPEYRKLRRVRKNMHKARKKAATVEPVTAKFWAATLEVYRHRCAYCPSLGPLEMDHFRPLARGGSHAPHNVLPACRNCNVSKGARDPFAFLEQAPGRLFFGIEDATSLNLT